jgi:hypothetical protein
MSMQRSIGSALVACLVLSSAAAKAQVPSRIPQTQQRAQNACDAAAARNGYRIIRRNPQTVNGSEYQLPLHVAHGATETDVTCRYDTQRGVAELPPWNDRPDRFPARTSERLSQTQLEAQQACQNAINTRAGYQARRVGTPVRHGAKQWDVPVTVRRDGTETMRVTCRYNGANGKVSLRGR